MKFSQTRSLRIIGAFVALAALAFAISCRGFFVNPTLTGVSVGPAGLDLNLNQTFQMIATGTYDDGTQKTLSSGVVWSSDNQSTVTVGQNSGLVTAVAVGTANITASSGGCSACSGSTSVTVVLNNITSIVVTPTQQTVSVAGTPVCFSATATPGGDITQTAIWQVFDSTNNNVTTNFNLQFVGSGTCGESFLPSSGVGQGTYTVQASYPSTTIVGKATLDVTP